MYAFGAWGDCSWAVGEDIGLSSDVREYLVLGSWVGSGMSCVAFTRTPELVSAMVSIRGIDASLSKQLWTMYALRTRVLTLRVLPSIEGAPYGRMHG